MNTTDILSAHAVIRFELARWYLGHAAVVRPEELGDIVTEFDRGNAVGGLVQYARKLRAAKEDYLRDTQAIIGPELPAIDVANIRARHVTCTGNTTIRLESHRDSFGELKWSFHADRAQGSGPLAASHPVLALLAGYKLDAAAKAEAEERLTELLKPVEQIA